jgi:FkbM family methyltransferase
MRISLKHWLRLRRDPWRKIFYDNFKRWKRDQMEPVRRRFDGLDANSVVFDVGGFEGNWADEVFNAYGATIHVFEPHPEFASQIEQRFSNNDKVVSHAVALGGAEGTLDLSDDGDASSVFVKQDGAKQGRVAEVGAYIDTLGVKQIDLMKMNIEGGEYDLLPALIATGQIAKVGTLQVQFHLYGPEFIEMRQRIVDEIEKTHDPVWSYPFVWEQWQLKTA